MASQMKRACTRFIVAAVLLVAATAWMTGSSGAQGTNALQTAQRDFNAGNYAVAISTLQPLVTQSSSNAEAFFWLGRNYYEISDYDSAVAQLRSLYDSVQVGPLHALPPPVLVPEKVMLYGDTAPAFPSTAM